MAKRVTAADAAGRGHNSVDGEKLRAYIERVERLFAEMESEKGSYMQRCKEIRSSINDVYDEAKALGISKKALKTHVSLRQMEQRKLRLVERLSDDDSDSFELMAEALGDFASLPLGMAAVEKVKKPSDADRAALETLN